MSSQRQIDANRRNARLSTGPQTPEGCDAVRFNALRHGLTAQTAVLHNENQEDFRQLLEAFQSEYQPAGPTENLLVEQMAMAAWRLRRLRAIETGLFNLRMFESKPGLRDRYPNMPDLDHRAVAFLDDTRGARAIENLFRYETRIERSFYKALREFERVRAAGLAPVPPDPPCAEDVPPPPEPDSAEQSQSRNRTPDSGDVPSLPAARSRHCHGQRRAAAPGGRRAFRPAGFSIRPSWRCGASSCIGRLLPVRLVGHGDRRGDGRNEQHPRDSRQRLLRVEGAFSTALD
ncbi:MAG TPA: hypothetical protein VLX58_21565 [Bryobacteraceae bacterium]|nr:hypothetical protein [Bryobacteraceae bacterium]